VYTGGIQVSGQVNLILMPGLYYMDGGGFSFTGQGNLTANGVLIYNDPKSTSDTITVNSTGSITWTPPTSTMYHGIAMWQRRDSTNTLSITGNGTSQMYGALYAQSGTLNVTGNGTQDVLGSQYIGYSVKLGGTGNFNISWNKDQTARLRILSLVE
jgi:hypothetical protein